MEVVERWNWVDVVVVTAEIGWSETMDIAVRRTAGVRDLRRGCNPRAGLDCWRC